MIINGTALERAHISDDTTSRNTMIPCAQSFSPACGLSCEIWQLRVERCGRPFDIELRLRLSIHSVNVVPRNPITWSLSRLLVRNISLIHARANTQAHRHNDDVIPCSADVVADDDDDDE